MISSLRRAKLRPPLGRRPLPIVGRVVDNKVRTRRLTTGLISDGYVEVRKGLTVADRVVAKAGTFLGDGEGITPIEPAGALAPPEPAAQPKAG